jgi:hypothetical protein
MISSLGFLKRDQLPLKLYQISSKWRDEIKPRLGLLRSREFIMKDMYTFDFNSEHAADTYDIVNNAYNSILNCIGIPHIKLLADTGTIGGSISHEYHYLSDIGEDVIYLCSNCNHYEGRFMQTESYCPNCKQPYEQINSVEVRTIVLIIFLVIWLVYYNYIINFRYKLHESKFHMFIWITVCSPNNPCYLTLIVFCCKFLQFVTIFQELHSFFYITLQFFCQSLYDKQCKYERLSCK